MTGLMELDLSSIGDEGLLVPFRRPDPTEVGRAFRGNGDNPPPKASLSRFFRRRASNDKHADEAKSSLLTKSTNEGRPARHLEDDHPEQATDSRFINESEEDSEGGADSDDDENDESEEEVSTDDSNDERSEGEHGRIDSAPINKGYREESDSRRGWDRRCDYKEGPLEHDSFSHKSGTRPLKLEGFGSAPPMRHSKDNAIGRFFRRITKRSDLKSMKIATEETKDDKTFSESLSHAVALAVTPVEYIEDENQEQTLGYYRTVTMEVESHLEDNPAMIEEHTKTVHWRKETKRLLARVGTLELELKNAHLEVTCWKERTSELEREVRKLRGHTSDDDSSIVSDETISEEESGVVETLDVPEELLLYPDIEATSPDFDPLSDFETAPTDTSNLLKLTQNASTDGASVAVLSPCIASADDADAPTIHGTD